MLRIGCCGFVRGRELYYRTFPLVEVQQTFYWPPKKETALGWRRDAPEGFSFAIKAWQVITHPATSPTYKRSGLTIAATQGANYGFFRLTSQVEEGWKATLELAQALRAEAVLFQYPASFTPEPEHVENLRRFFRGLAPRDFLLAWEPRGRWPEELVRQLCQELRLVHCVDPFDAHPQWGSPFYLRIHGGKGYRGTFTDQQLHDLAQRYGDGEGYVLFNNLSMFQDALRLRGIVESAKGDAPSPNLSPGGRGIYIRTRRL